MIDNKIILIYAVVQIVIVLLVCSNFIVMFINNLSGTQFIGCCSKIDGLLIYEIIGKIKIMCNMY